MKLIRQIVLTVTWTELLAMNDSNSVKMQASGRQRQDAQTAAA